MQPFVNASVVIASIGVLIWFSKRFIERERAFTQDGTSEWSRESRALGHLMDAVALILIISPIVWNIGISSPCHLPWYIAVPGRRNMADRHCHVPHLPFLVQVCFLSSPAGLHALWFSPPTIIVGERTFSAWM
jgi:hypothetical protein